MSSRAPVHTVDILGVPVACVTTRQLLELVTAWVAPADPGGPQPSRMVCYVNAHCFNAASQHPAYHATLNEADLVYPDGISVVWASRLLGGRACQMQKSTGADWIGQFCQLAAARGWRIYILAGQPEIAQRARVNLVRQYPDLQIVGVCDGFFRTQSEAETLRDIARTAPHILFVGMGTPRQESWIAARRTQMGVPVCWAVGALFDYVAGTEPRVPRWMNGLALEWFWRLLMDPVGKWRRYILGNPLFVTRIARQIIRAKLGAGASSDQPPPGP